MKFKYRRRGMQRTQRLNTIGCMLLSSSTEQQNFIEGTDLLTTVDPKTDRQVNFSNHRYRNPASILLRSKACVQPFKSIRTRSRAAGESISSLTLEECVSLAGGGIREGS